MTVNTLTKFSTTILEYYKFPGQYLLLCIVLFSIWWTIHDLGPWTWLIAIAAIALYIMEAISLILAGMNSFKIIRKFNDKYL
jgi:membrane protein YdbS with pleckstrin-like domain